MGLSYISCSFGDCNKISCKRRSISAYSLVVTKIKLTKMCVLLFTLFAMHCSICGHYHVFGIFDSLATFLF